MYFVLQNFVLEKYLRYMFTVYPVLIFAFTGVITNLQYGGSKQNIICASVNISAFSLLFLISIALFVYRSTQRNAKSSRNEKKGHELA